MSYSHERHVQGTFFGPRPLGHWGGAKRSNIIEGVGVSPYRKFTKGSAHTWIFIMLCILIV